MGYDPARCGSLGRELKLNSTYRLGWAMGEEEGEAGAPSLPAMNKGRKRSLRAMEGEPRSTSRKQATRRSARVMRMKELAGTSEELRRILHLQREVKDLEDLRREVDRRHKRYQNLIFTTEDGEKILPSDSDDEAAEEAAGKEEKRKKKMKVVTEKVPQGLIEYYILNTPHHARPSFNPEFTEYVLRKRSQSFREFYTVRKAIAQKTWEYLQAIVEQFRTKDYALDYSEVEEEEDDDDEEEKN